MNWLEVGFRVDQVTGKLYWPGEEPPVVGQVTVAGLGGRSARFDMSGPQNDPFPLLMNPDIFDAVRVRYPASMFPMSASIDYCVEQVIDGVNALPVGHPWGVGGYSQGAAAMSTIYNELRYGTLTSRASSFVGGVMFGNPRRQAGFRGPVGGTWDGTWDQPPTVTTGGQGSFPSTGSYSRLSSCSDNWVEFTYPGDVFTANGTSTVGSNWSIANGLITSLDVTAIIAYLATGASEAILAAVGEAFAAGGEKFNGHDAAGQEISVSGSGHVAYGVAPPYDVSTDQTCYQIAMQWLEDRASAWATAPILQPTAGWSATLLPPAV